MTTALITHPDGLKHETPQGHPEQVARLQAIFDTLGAAEFDGLLRCDAEMGTDEQVLLAHPSTHLNAIKSASPQTGTISLDADTHMSAGSLTAAMRGVGGICQAVDMVMSGDAGNAFCAMRPPGHHAEKTTPMGFCLFGNVAIGAKYALENYGLKRVAIVDFDVHHGNGTQDLIWDDERILFVSTHQMPLYPGTGYAHETGAHGNVLNIPIDTGATGAALLGAMNDQILPALIAHQPEILFISAGFDAHRDDPLAGLNFETEDFAIATGSLCDFARDHCSGRLVSTLEGGYDLRALAQSCAAHIRVLMEYSK
ncbi:acetoin utilization protein [Amylibacter kogurei]|uniref:Acetoin utilization protein n=1 Tax=Paramylibacter kogurei TaxID=1889778 RepID=A0A2G5KAF0_9RHOB|nr:histone deacetylase family protein [Amylibacter kogurei]PIB26506.1 acetoin utilization protein [Amylibacter kogurei]